MSQKLHLINSTLPVQLGLTGYRSDINRNFDSRAGYVNIIVGYTCTIGKIVRNDQPSPYIVKPGNAARWISKWEVRKCWVIPESVQLIVDGYGVLTCSHVYIHSDPEWLIRDIFANRRAKVVGEQKC